MLAPTTITELARELYQARKTRTQVRHFSKRHPQMTVEDGYAVQGATMTFPVFASPEAFLAEMVKRGEARKRVALLNLVAKIDKDMVLSKDQREKISESLKKNWKSGWDQSLEMFMHGDENVPRPADEMVVPFLNETQKQAWRDSNTGQNQFWGWGGWGGFGVLVEDDAVGN